MKDFIEISQYSGMREDLVQASGGNSSCKINDTEMIIKSSGIQLSEVTEKVGYSVVNYVMLEEYLKALIKGENIEDEKEILRKILIRGNRPSIETFLHAITGKVTLHTHSVAVNVLTSRKGGMETLKEMFPQALIVDYATPGLKLAELYYRSYLDGIKSGSDQFNIIFLKNHGLIVSAENASEVIKLTEEVITTIEKKVGLDNRSYRKAYEIYNSFKNYGVNENSILVKVENERIKKCYEAFNYKMWKFQVCPDSIVFCGKSSFVYSSKSNKSEFDAYVEQYGMPVIIECDKEIYIRTESVRKAREIESVLAFTAEIAYLNRENELELISEEEQNFLLNWDAEKYRRMLK